MIESKPTMLTSDRPASSTSIETKPEIKPKVKSRKRKSSEEGDTKPSKAAKNSRKWTDRELEQLFLSAVKQVGVKDFEGRIEGRSGNQCYQTWVMTLKPFLTAQAKLKGVKTD